MQTATTKRAINLFIPILLLVFTNVHAQSVGINTTGAPPNPSAIVDIDVSALATKKGLLIPRVTAAERGAMSPLAAPAQGLIVYQTDGAQGFYFNKSTTTTAVWDYLTTSATAGWSLTGNAGTTDGANFIGTTDAAPLNFRVNNVRAGRIEPGDFAGGLTAIGYEAALNNANSITAFGYRAARNNLGQGNTAVGWNALSTDTNGYFNTAVGAEALYLARSGSNTAVGYRALRSNGAAFGDNTAVGYNALVNNAGNSNCAFGSSALDSNTTGELNTAMGFQAMHNNSTGQNNTAHGAQALMYNKSGAYNTAIGALAGATPADTAGNYNIFIGYNARSTGNLENAIAIGKNALVSRSNSMVLGGTGADAVNVGIGINEPYSTLHVYGSFSVGISSASANYTLTGANHSLVIKGAGGYTITLPAANTCPGRMYALINHATSPCTTSVAYISPTGLPVSSIANNNSIWIQSDGTDWQQIK